MKATINNKPVFIDWVHYPVDSEGIPAGTHCRICDTTPAREILAVGQTILSKKDKFEKKSGRKLSLARALKAADVLKSDREVIWKTFLTNIKQ